MTYIVLIADNEYKTKVTNRIKSYYRNHIFIEDRIALIETNELITKITEKLTIWDPEEMTGRGGLVMTMTGAYSGYGCPKVFDWIDENHDWGYQENVKRNDKMGYLGYSKQRR